MTFYAGESAQCECAQEDGEQLEHVRYCIMHSGCSIRALKKRPLDVGGLNDRAHECGVSNISAVASASQ